MVPQQLFNISAYITCHINHDIILDEKNEQRAKKNKKMKV